MNTRLLSLAFVSALTIASFTPALAEDSIRDRFVQRLENREEKREEREERRDDRQASREARLNNRCENVYKRIDARLKNYEARKDNHIPVYQKMLTRLQQLSTTLASKGYDTTKLNADLVTLDTMLKTAAANYQAFIDELTALKSLDCETARASFLTNLSESKTKLQQFRTSAAAIHEFFKNTIKVDLKALRSQKPTPTPQPTTTQ